MSNVPYKTLIELGYLLLGLAAAIVVAELSAWSYPWARDDVWVIAYIVIAATLAMGIRPLRRAWIEDRKRQYG